MSTSKDELRAWFREAKALGATHMIVVCDTFSHEDYPVTVKPGENVREIAKHFDGVGMQRIMEVYAMHLDEDAQMNEGRAFHYEDATQDPAS